MIPELQSLPTVPVDPDLPSAHDFGVGALGIIDPAGHHWRLVARVRP